MRNFGRVDESLTTRPKERNLSGFGKYFAYNLVITRTQKRILIFSRKPSRFTNYGKSTIPWKRSNINKRYHLKLKIKHLFEKDVLFCCIAIFVLDALIKLEGFYNEGALVEPVRGSSGESIQDEEGSGDWNIFYWFRKKAFCL